MMAVTAADTNNDDANTSVVSDVSVNDQSKVESNVLEKNMISIKGDSTSSSATESSQLTTSNNSNTITGNVVENSDAKTNSINKQESNIKSSTSKIDTTINTENMVFVEKGKKVNLTASVQTTAGKTVTAGTLVFKVNGISVGTANIVNNKASVLYDTSDLSYKTYTVTIKYAGSTSYNSCQTTSNLKIFSSANKYTFSQIGDAANRTKVFVENNNHLPNYVVIGKEKVTMDDFLYLLSKTSIDKSSVVNGHFTAVSSSGSTTGINTKIYKDEYSSISNQIINAYEKTDKNPSKVTCSAGTMTFNDSVYFYARLVAYMYNNGAYPNYCTVLNLSTSYDDFVRTQEKQDISITLKSFEVNPNTSSTISASVVYANGSKVNGVTAVFKVNGITIGSTKISNGVASLTFDVPNWKIKNYTLMAKVGETSGNYEGVAYSTLSVVKFVTKKTHIVLDSSYVALKGQKATLTAKILDENNNAVTGGKFVFKINGVSMGTVTVSNGVASLSVGTSSLSVNKVATVEAIYGGTSKYLSSRNSSDLRVVSSLNTYTYAQVLDASVRVRNYIQTNSNLPKYVVIGNDQVSMSDYLFLAAKVLTSNSTFYKGNFAANNTAYNTTGYDKNLVTSEYTKCAKNIISFYETNSRAPSAISTANGTVNFADTVYIYSRVVAFLSENKVLPNYAVILQANIDTSSTSGNVVPSGYSQYLVATKNCAVNNSIFKTAVAKATAGVTGAYNQAKAIFNYVNKYTSYSYYADTRYGSIQTLSQGYGNCVDMAHVCIAMFRTANLPARYVHGKNCVFRSGLVTGHVWAEVYVNGKWYACDATSDSNSFGTIVNWSRNSGEVRYTELPF